MTVPSDRDDSLPQVKDATHAAHLALCKTQKERVAYACEVLTGATRPTSADVLNMLELYGFLPNRRTQTANVRTLVSKWRAAHGMADTGGPIPTMTTEMLELMDQRAAASKEATEHPRPTLQVIRSTQDDDQADLVDQDAAMNEGQADARTPVQDPEKSEFPQVTAPVEVPAATPEPTSVKAPAKRRAPLLLGLISLVAMGLSADTSLRFFGEKLQVADPYRFFLFAVMELTLLGCALAMFESVRDHGRPGPMRFVAWAVCAVSGFAAMELSGPLDGPLRTLLGPVLALVLLHAALGIEIRAGRVRTTMWSRIGREFRERFLSRLGLGDDDRTALQRTRERAAVRLAYLATATGWVPLRTARMRRANRQAGTAHDPVMKARVEREHHSLDQLGRLREVKHGDFWNAR